MKIFTFLTLFSLVLNTMCVAQSEGENIVVEKTDMHANFKNSKHQINPPLGFNPMTNNGINAFVHLSEVAQILIMEIPIPMSMAKTEFTNDALSFKGVKVSERVNFKLNGLDAVMITGVQQEGSKTVTKFIMFTGTESSMVMVNGIVSQGSPLTADVKKSLLTFIGAF